jgi:hypothetical protein
LETENNTGCPDVFSAAGELVAADCSPAAQVSIFPALL